MSATAVLIVADWSSKCSACGEAADPKQSHHETILPGYSGSGSRPGCGAKFVAKRPDMCARQSLYETPLAGFRPDLPLEAS